MVRIFAAFLIFLIIVTVVLYLLRRPALTYIGEYLVLKTSVETAGAIAVLTGSMPQRVLEAVKLYEAGYGRVIIITRGETSVAGLALEKKGIDIVSEADNNEMIARKLGVPSSNISVLETGVNSTYSESLAVLNYLRRKGIDTIIVVTSKTHTRRADIIFKRVFGECGGENIKIMTVPTSYDDFDPAKWWKVRSSLRNVALEYQKLAYLFLFEDSVCSKP